MVTDYILYTLILQTQCLVYENFYLAIGSTFYGFINFERLSAMVYHENTQDHVKKTGLYFHIRGWLGYFGSGHAGLESLL